MFHEVTMCSLFVRHCIPSIVHHVTEEDNKIWMATKCSPPALAEIEIHDELTKPHQPRGTIRVGAMVKNLWVRNYEYVSRDGS